MWNFKLTFKPWAIKVLNDTGKIRNKLLDKLDGNRSENMWV